ncbi:hypothetical protein COBT_000549 [Conglomerata obtusa]
MTNILYTLLLSNILCANEHIYTHENIFEELVECQSQVIESQKNCFELHKFDTFIVISFDNEEDGFRTMLDEKISELINEYIEVVGNTRFKITAKNFNDSYKYLQNIVILEFFKSAYTFNHCISKEIKTICEIYKEYEYFTAQGINSVHQMNDALDKYNNGQIQCKCHECEQNEDNNYDICEPLNKKIKKILSLNFKNIILIDNCLLTLQDYELFYNEIKEHIEDINFYPTSLIFIALKLNKAQKLKFTGNKKYEPLSNKEFNGVPKLEYHAAFLENRTPFGLLIKNIDDVIGRLYTNERKFLSPYVLDAYFGKLKNNHHASIHTYNSFAFSIFMFEIICNPKFLPFDLANKYFLKPKNDKMKRICILNNFDNIFVDMLHVEEFIEGSVEEKKKLLTSIYIKIHSIWYSFSFSAEYSYYVSVTKTNISNLFIKNDKLLSENDKQQHNIIVNVVKNIKSLLSKSFMHYNIYFMSVILSRRNNMYIDYCNDLCPENLSIIWDYENIETSLDIMKKAITNISKSKVNFVLFEYELDLKSFLFNLALTKNLRIFRYVKHLTQVDDDMNELVKNTNNNKNLCLQICIEDDAYAQYYYLFLPCAEFQILSYIKTNNEYKIKNEFSIGVCKIITNDNIYVSKQENYGIILNEFMKIDIPLKVIYENITKLNEVKLLYILNIIILKKSEELFPIEIYNKLKREEKQLLDNIIIPLKYDSIEVHENFPSDTILETPYIKKTISDLQKNVSQCFARIAEMIGTDYENKRQNCYIQSGNDYPVLSKMEELTKLLKDIK